MKHVSNRNTTRLNSCGKRGIAREFALIIIGAVLLFSSAGTINWIRGWIFISITFLYQVSYVSMLLIINPQLLNERGNLNWRETKLHDKYFTILYTMLGFSAIIIAGLDVVRFKWSVFPFFTVYAGIAAFVLASFLALWAYATNSFFILTQRENKISGQQVCTTGPYRYIRHPGYSGAIISALTYPFILGSLFGLIPILLIVVLLVIRTYNEDKTLEAELDGYEEYSKKTKYRLFPYLW